MLHAKNPNIITKSSNDVSECEKIKIEAGQVAIDFDAEMKNANEMKSNSERKYCLPSGHYVTIREERLKCPELLFAPAAMGLGQDGIHKHTYDSIMKCDPDIKKDLFQNIVLAGGCTMFKGIKSRMTKEIQALAASPMKPEVFSPADRKHSCWLGGAILSQMKKFDNIWITKKEFDEEGKSIVHKKCF